MLIIQNLSSVFVYIAQICAFSQNQAKNRIAIGFNKLINLLHSKRNSLFGNVHTQNANVDHVAHLDSLEAEQEQADRYLSLMPQLSDEI